MSMKEEFESIIGRKLDDSEYMELYNLINDEVEKWTKKYLKKTDESISYSFFGKEHIPDEQTKKRRAWAYLLALTAINDVGAGADDNLGTIRAVIGMLTRICEHETGYKIINNYATNEVGSNYSGWKKNPYSKNNMIEEGEQK